GYRRRGAISAGEDDVGHRHVQVVEQIAGEDIVPEVVNQIQDLLVARARDQGSGEQYRYRVDRAGQRQSEHNARFEFFQEKRSARPVGPELARPPKRRAGSKGTATAVQAVPEAGAEAHDVDSLGSWSLSAKWY